MCGIAGIVATDWSRERTEAALRRMCSAMVHRGPDDEGLRWESGVGLAMRRLSIVDIAGGHQPISNDDGTLHIVYNGEIYNAPALRQKLIERGHRFRTRSDTEVIVRLYQDEGLHFADELRGMWAIAIHDTRFGRVVLSRDRVGIKPLYVYTEGARTIFASELRAFRAIAADLGPGALACDPAAANAMLSWSYVPGAATIYRSIRRIEPGTHEVITSAGFVMRRKYWELRANSDAQSVRSLGEAAELTSAELRRAVREHLESDVPVGAFVSGGIDSGLVAASAADAAPGLATFSVGFDDVPAFDETAHAAAVAKALGSRHVVRRMDASDVYGALVEVLARSDAPFGDSSLIATWAISRVASQTHRVVLTGDGGDEVFAGYVKHSIVKWRERLRAIPGVMFRAADVVLRGLPQSRERRVTDLVRKLRRGLHGLGVSPEVGYAALTRIASLDETSALMLDAPRESPFRDLVERVFAAAPGEDELAKTLAADIAIVLPDDMLTKVDQASMLNSLEARVPLLDHRLLEVGWSLPDPFRRGPQGKLVLRELFRRRFGDRLAGRPKQGFQVPVESWLAGPLGPALDWAFAPTRLARHGLLTPSCFTADRRRAMLAKQPLLLWNAFCLAVWCEVSVGSVDETELRSILTDRPNASGPTRNGTRPPSAGLRVAS